MIYINTNTKEGSTNKDIIDKLAYELGKQDIDINVFQWILSLFEDGIYIVDRPSHYEPLNDVATLKHSIILFPFYISYLILNLAVLEESEILDTYNAKNLVGNLRKQSYLLDKYYKINKINPESYVYKNISNFSVSSYKDIQELASSVFGIEYELQNDVYRSINKILLAAGYSEDYIYSYLSMVSTNNKALLTQTILENLGVDRNIYITNILKEWQCDVSKIFRLSTRK